MKPVDPSRTYAGFGFTSGVAACAILVSATVFQTQPVHAGNSYKKMLGVGAGIAIGGAILNELRKGKKKAGRAVKRRYKSKRRRRSRDAVDGGGDSGGDDYVSVRQAKNFAAVLAELKDIERSRRLEEERDVKQAISRFIRVLEIKHKDLKRRGRAGKFVNQVTAGELERSLDTSYKAGRLYQYDRFAGEMWTRDRLKVRVLRTAQRGLHRYFDGVGAKGPSMRDLDDLLVRSSHKVHANALEINEVIGVSNSFDRFIRTIFEYSDRADQNLWTTGADSRYERLVTTVMDSIPQPPVRANVNAQMDDEYGLQNRFQFRFRARRALYDCLSSRYPQLVKQNEQRKPGGTGNLIPIKYNAHGQPQKPADQGAGGQAPANQESGMQTAYGTQTPKADHRGLQPNGMATQGGPSNGGSSDQAIKAHAQQGGPSNATPRNESDEAAHYQIAQNSSKQTGSQIKPENIWYRAKNYVGSVCRSAIEQVAREAYHGQIKPVSARWVSSAASTNQQSGSPRQLLYQNRPQEPGYGRQQQTGYRQGYEQQAPQYNRPQSEYGRAPAARAPTYDNSGAAAQSGYYDRRQPQQQRQQYGPQGNYGRGQ